MGLVALSLLQILLLVNVSAPTGITAIANDADIGTSSLATLGGQKLIEDSFGRTIVVYVDDLGGLAIAFTNSNPQVVGLWARPVETPVPSVPYTRPAAVMLSPASLRIIVEGGTGKGMINDVPVTVKRDSGNNIIGVSFGAPTILDASGLARYPTAIVAHNGDILAAWNWLNATSSSRVKAFRWNSISKSWTGFNGTGSVPDDALVDASNRVEIFATLIQRLDNDNVYLLGNRGLNSTTLTTVFAKAVFSILNWSWGGQNLNYERGLSLGLTDSPSAAWDSGNNLVVVSQAFAGMNSYSVFTLDASDAKIHIDTPLTLTTNNEWGSLEVNATSGAYYLFFIDTTATSTVHGRVGYLRRVSGAWNSTFNVIDSGTNNEGISVRRSGDSCCIDLVYGKGITTPAKLYFVRISPSTPILTSITLGTSSNQLFIGQTPVFSGTLTSATNGSAVPGRTVNIQESLDLSTWSTITSVNSGSDGSYATSLLFNAAGIFHIRALFQGDNIYDTSLSPIVDLNVALNMGFSNSYALIAGKNATLYAFNGTALARIGVPSTADLLTVSWTPDGSYALVAGSGGTLLKVTTSGNNVNVQNIPTGLSKRIVLYAVAWRPDGSLALIGGTNGTIISYNGQKVTLVPSGLTSSILSMAWNSTGKLALVAGVNGFIATYNGTTFKTISSPGGYSFNAMGWNPSGFAYIGGTFGALFKYNGTLSRVSNSTMFGNTVENILFNPAGGTGLITGNVGMVITYTQGVLKRLSSFTDLSGHSQPLSRIGNLYSTAWGTGTRIAYTVGTNGTVANILGTNVVLVSQHVTNQTFTSISWRLLSTNVSAVSVVRGLDNKIYWSSLASSWSPWQSISGRTASSPVTCSTGPRSLDLLVRGADNLSIWHTSYSNGAWSGWDNPGGATDAQPACAFMGGLLHIVVRGLNEGIWYISRNDTSGQWGQWTSLGGQVFSSPVLIASPSLKRLDLVVQGGANTIWHMAFVNGAWTQIWDSPGGATPNIPSAVSDGTSLHLVVDGMSNTLWYDSLNYTSGSWTGWFSLGGSTPYSPTLALDISGKLHLVVVGMGEGKIWHMARSSGGSWSGWDSAGGTSVNPLGVTSFGSNVVVLARDASQGVSSNILVGSTWQGWVNLGAATPSAPSISSVS